MKEEYQDKVIEREVGYFKSDSKKKLYEFPEGIYA